MVTVNEQDGVGSVGVWFCGLTMVMLGGTVPDIGSVDLKISHGLAFAGGVHSEASAVITIMATKATAAKNLLLCMGCRTNQALGFGAKKKFCKDFLTKEKTKQF